ncbi:mitochondrial ribosomal death-associated protein 3-domain-containing protein [Sphaerosporella brunnea]|uniref:Small ribosomal subunit protein mS29 n=1 Tax=Sphaerosporella brunnea TaxID=1250544 RepID=A0A5J5ED94_9PEZI|nr:mitochondrial ribosomal death-associated protein 3-domain-containing protein [Sphaerosporella brunnea]
MVLSTAGRRCLRPSTFHQLSRLTATPATATATFTTSAPAQTKSGKPAVKGMSRQMQQGQQRIGRNTGPAADQKPKAPFKPGERRDIRQRIVLSNTNAPAVDVAELSFEVSTREEYVGTVFAFGAKDIDSLRELDGFRRSQDWKFFHRPSTVMRKESLRLGEMMEWVQQQEELPQTRCERLVLTGPKGSGKSVLLLQAMAWALQRQWVVINIPNAADLVIGHTEYEHDSASGLWAQREYTRTLLNQIANANRGVLKNLTLSKAYKLRNHDFPADFDLLHFCKVGSDDSAVSHEVFTVLLEELSQQGRLPVLFTLDSLNFMMRESEYRDPDFNIIHAHDLALPRYFIEYLNGTRKFAKGLVIGATSAAGAPRTDALEYALNGWKLPVYSNLDERIAPSIKGAEVIKVGAMEKNEAKSLLEYCRESGLLREPTRLDEEKVAQRYTLSSGLPKELVAGCVRLTA